MTTWRRRLVSIFLLATLTAGAKGQEQERDDTRFLEPLDVVADRSRKDPGSYSVIGRADIDTGHADHPAEILNIVPGVNIQMNAGQENLMAIRSPVLNAGAGQGSFLLLENRIPIRAAAFGNVNALFEILHENAAFIEVVRGPGSAQYGSNAVHGIVGVNLDAPTALPGYRVRAGLSTLGRGFVDAAGGGLIPSVRSSYSLSVQQDNGWRDSSGFGLQKGHASISWDAGQWQLTGFLSAFRLAQQTAGFIEGLNAYSSLDTAKSNPNPDAYRNAGAVRLHLRAERQWKGYMFSLTPFFLTQAMDFSQHFLPNGGVETNGHDSFGLQARVQSPQDNTLAWTLGADGQWASGALKEEQAEPFGFFPADMRFPQGIHYDYTVQTLVGAGFADITWTPVAALRVRAGLRAETHAYDYDTRVDPGTYGRFKVTPDRQDSYAFVTPKFGVIYAPLPALHLYANYAAGARAPQASDLYRLQSAQEPGEILAETVNSFEIGARGLLGGGGSGSLSYDIAGYSMDKDNYFFRDADRLNVPDGKTHHQGVEASVRAQLGSFFLRGGVSWAEHTYRFDRQTGSMTESITAGDRVDTAPEWLGNMRLGYDDGTLSISFSANYVGMYFTDAANLHSYPGHVVFGLNAQRTLTNNASLFAYARNLLDTRYADRADFAFGSARFFPGEPFAIGVGLRFTRR